MKAYTDLNQSKKLAEILPLESADMYWWSSGKRYYIEAMDDGDFVENRDIRAWSLAALLELLNYPQLSKDKLGSGRIGWMVSVYPDNCRYDSRWHDNPVDACYEMIIKLHDSKML